MTRKTAASVLVLLAWISACRPSEPGPKHSPPAPAAFSPPTNDSGPGTSRRNESPGIAQRPAALSLAKAFSAQGQSHLLRASRIEDEFREAIDASPPSTFLLRARVPEPAELRFSYGISQRNWEKANLEFTFVVYVDVAGKDVRRLYCKRVARNDPYHDWVDVDVPLDDYAGKDVRFLFQVMSETRNWKEKSTPFDGIPVWAGVGVVPRVPPGASKRTSFLWITIDTLRADHLGCYGYRKPVSPTLDSLAARGLLFESAISHSPWTRPSTASMLFGSLPHRISPPASAGELFRILPDQPSIQGALQEAGYDTVAVTPNHNLHPEFGFMHGFSSYYTAATDEIAYQYVDRVLSRDTQKPFFLFFQPMGPHHPYTFVPGVSEAFVDKEEGERLSRTYDQEDKLVATPPTGKDLTGLLGLYDGKIRQADALVEKILRRLQELGKLESTFIVITSDHGEEFGDHGGWTHGHTVYDELLHVPLILVPPGSTQGRRYKDPVGLFNIAPTLLDVAGIQAPDSFLGKSLLRNPAASGSPILSENLWTGHRISVRSKSIKYIAQTFGAKEEVYDLEHDPQERKNLSQETQWLQAGRGIFRQALESIGYRARRQTIKLLFSSNAEHGWRFTFHSSSPTVPIVTPPQAQEIQWAGSSTFQDWNFEFRTKQDEPVTLMVPVAKDLTQLSMKVEIDGRPVSEKEMVIPAKWSGSVTELLSNVVSEKAREALENRGQPVVHGRRDAVMLAWTSENVPFIPSAFGETGYVDTLKALGYVQ